MMNASTTEHMQQATHKMMKAYEDMGNMAQEHMDATMKSTTAMTKGIDELARNTLGLLQESFARVVTAGKTLTSARSPREVMDMHSELMRDFMDSWMAGTGKISEISARVTQDVMAPMTEHTHNTVSKIMQNVKAA